MRRESHRRSAEPAQESVDWTGQGRTHLAKTYNTLKVHSACVKYLTEFPAEGLYLGTCQQEDKENGSQSASKVTGCAAEAGYLNTPKVHPGRAPC